eukprot:5695506-Amphidinium_carterae.1
MGNAKESMHYKDVVECVGLTKFYMLEGNKTYSQPSLQPQSDSKSERVILVRHMGYVNPSHRKQTRLRTCSLFRSCLICPCGTKVILTEVQLNTAVQPPYMLVQTAPMQ